MESAVDEDWSVLQSLLPSGWRERAWTAGAMARVRGITSPERLLRLVLLHVGKGYSLRETCVRGRQAELSTISDVGLLKRLRRCEEWLRWLCVQLLAENGVDLAGPGAGQRNVRIVDGTLVREPGRTGSQWRIIYSLRLPSLECDFFDLSSASGKGTGESLSRIPVAPHDLLLADAGYSKAPGIQALALHGADVLVRLNPRSLPLLDEHGAAFNLLDKLATLTTAGQVGEWNVRPQGTTVDGRICAVRKSAQAISQAQRRLERRASKKCTHTLPETREYAKYVLIFTTERSSPASVILDWYRLRWQVELAFKRLKSLVQLGHLPKHDAHSSRVWLYGKLLVALLTQKLIRLGRTFSPWGYSFTAPAAQ